MRLGSRELLAVLEGVQNGTVTLSEKPEMTDGPDSNESTGPENPSESADGMGMVEMAENQTGTVENTTDRLSVKQGLPEDTAAEREDF